MNKQIEEIKAVLVRTHKRARTRQEDYMQDRYAEAIYNAGYRKTSAVAREIFEEIERAFFKHYDEQVTYSSPTLPYHTRDILGFSLNVLFTEIEKLKKKYESEGADDD